MKEWLNGRRAHLKFAKIYNVVILAHNSQVSISQDEGGADFQWLRRQGGTQTSSTGPTGDRTTNSAAGQSCDVWTCLCVCLKKN